MKHTSQIGAEILKLILTANTSTTMVHHYVEKIEKRLGKKVFFSFSLSILNKHYHLILFNIVQCPPFILHFFFSNEDNVFTLVTEFKR